MSSNVSGSKSANLSRASLPCARRSAGCPVRAIRTWRLTLADASGAIGAFVFDQPDFFAAQFEAGDRVRVAGQVIQRQGRPVVRVRHIRPAGDEVGAEEFLPRSHREPDELMGFARQPGRRDRRRQAFKAMAMAVLDDPALAAGWLTAPCSRSGHHAYQGGLLEHTVGVASLAQTLCQWHPASGFDLLVAAALVHDVGHIRGWRLAATFELTDEGRMLGAPGDRPRDRRRGGARRSAPGGVRRLGVLHAVGWHHGPPAGQGPGGASPEALALWRINSLEVGVKTRLEGPGPIDE